MGPNITVKIAICIPNSRCIWFLYWIMHKKARLDRWGEIILKPKSINANPYAISR